MDVEVEEKQATIVRGALKELENIRNPTELKPNDDQSHGNTKKDSVKSNVLEEKYMDGCKTLNSDEKPSRHRPTSSFRFPEAE